MRLALLALLVAACGGDGGGNPSGPHLIAGGGVSNAPIDGTLSVYVVEVDSSTPIANATVHVGSAMATTDATGLATFMVSGPQTISASASGHAGVTWVGVQGSNVTLPLEPTPHNPPTAKASGTIAGWDQLPSPNFGHYNLAVVIYSFLDDPTAAENRLTQPGGSGGAPANTCVDANGSTACNWQLVTRTGMQVHTAVILDGDAHGTQDPADDTYSVIGFAAGSPMMMTAGQNLANETLNMVTATTTVSAQVPAAPAGLPKVTAIPELAIGDAGRVVFPLPGITPSSASVEVMAAMGAFAGSFHIVAVAAPQTGSLPYSTSFATGAQATLPAWLSPPTGLAGGATFTFGASSGANLYTAQVAKSDMAPVWNVTVLDGSTSFPITDSLSGAATFTVTAAEVTGLDVTNFTVGDVKTKLARAAGAQIPFTR